VGLAVITVLLSILLPALGVARDAAHVAICGSNIRQLAIANTTYSFDHEEYFVLAAEDIFAGFGGTIRWHGVRQANAVSADASENTFDPSLGPLALYLGITGQVKECPAFRNAIQDGGKNAYESGAGGYGYNALYIGGRYDLYGAQPMAAQTAARMDMVKQPNETVMFTDTAFVQGSSLIEYSFCEPPLQQDSPGLPTQVRPKPSIHFRHPGDHANVAWVDGHVGAESFAFTYPGPTEAIYQAMRVGWFGPGDNELFDLY